MVGTGGKSLYDFRANPVNGSRVRLHNSAGVLFLNLWERSYYWAFKTIDGGAVADSGSAACV